MTRSLRIDEVESPIRRLGKPEDIAGLTVFLVSNEGSYLCGQILLLDGMYQPTNIVGKRAES